MHNRIAYLPLSTYPEAPPDPAVTAAVVLAAALNCGVQASLFEVDVPKTASPISGFLINVEGMAQAVEQRSKAECARLQTLIAGAAPKATVASHKVMLGGALDAATTEARTCDLALLPWSADTISAQDMAQSLVFDAGVPVILVPPTATAASVNHIAIAWDGSRVAARALCDALPLLAEGGHVSVVTVEDEKSLGAPGIADTLTAALQRRGFRAKAVNITLDGRTIAAALQETALSEGAQLLAMGGFGHSRLRDFILGGATKGVFAELRLPVLLSH
ncbi:universal stress protein [Tabrizicola sp. BL-A-41-H6]|uniref:universal stress protein n=1 Tax=Tabrizicola sp. BL-A-41-H6 TaxID=3421107 RepID=UPI003D66F026